MEIGIIFNDKKERISVNPTAMTLQQFEYLSEHDQELILHKRAVHIATIIDRKDILTLFQVDGFYLEIQSTAGHFYKTSSFFEETELLDPYLEIINIDNIYALLGPAGHGWHFPPHQNE